LDKFIQFWPLSKAGILVFLENLLLAPINPVYPIRILTALYLLLSYSEFVKLLDYNQKRGSGYDVRFYVDFVQMLEHSLAFYEWSMKREHDINTIIGHDGTTETSKAPQSVRRYLSLMKRCCLREEMGKTYKIPKFHQLLHLVSAIV